MSSAAFQTKLLGKWMMILWMFISPHLQQIFEHGAGLSTNLNPYYNSTNYPESNLVKNYCRNPFEVIISEWPHVTR